MSILWTIIIGFVAGVIAKFITPGTNEPSGFILTTILGIIGAFVATWLGQALGWYRPDEGAGLIGAVVGAIIVLVIWGMVDRAAEFRPHLVQAHRLGKQIALSTRRTRRRHIRFENKSGTYLNCAGWAVS